VARGEKAIEIVSFADRCVKVLKIGAWKDRTPAKTPHESA
jgi:hypothetical protein